MKLKYYKKINDNIIINFLLFVISFSIFLGSGISMFVSNLFIISSLLLIFYWVFIFLDKNVFINYYPKFLNFFLIYIILHTLIFLFKYKSIYNSFYLYRIIFFYSVGFVLAISLNNLNNYNSFNIFMGISMVISVIFGFSKTYGYSELRVGGGFTDPNTFASYIMFVLFISLFLFVSSRKKSLKVVNFVIFILSFVFILLSGSRTIIISSLFGFFVIFCCIIYDKKLKLKSRFKILILVFLFILLITVLVPRETLLMNINRLSYDRITRDQAAGRFEVWKNYLLRFDEYFLVGVGAGRAREATGFIKNPHNTYIKIFVEFGILGLILYLFFLLEIFFKLLKSQIRYNYIIIGLFISFVISHMALGVLTLRSTWIIIAFISSFISLKTFDLGKGYKWKR